jgi:hypothetical protein
MSTLLSIGNDAKTVKGEKQGYLTGILYLAPAHESGVNVCPFSSVACRHDCLYTAGRGGFESVKRARIAKTQYFHRDRQSFLEQLGIEILKLKAKAARAEMVPAVRLNGTSDIEWHRLEKGALMERFSEVQFYDYTPNHVRYIAWMEGKLPANYHLTFSRKEDNEPIAQAIAASGGNVAVVFREKQFPAEFWNRPVINGDESDLRFLDPQGVIVALSAKGKAKKDGSGFVVDSAKYAQYFNKNNK